MLLQACVLYCCSDLFFHSAVPKQVDIISHSHPYRKRARGTCQQNCPVRTEWKAKSSRCHHACTHRILQEKQSQDFFKTVTELIKN